MTSVNPRIEMLIQVLDQAFDRAAWHGTNLRGSLRGLQLDLVLWRPRAGRHNIWEIALHTAYWKFTVRRHLIGDRSLRFARPGSDWPRLPGPPDERAWKRDLALLGTEHRALRETLTGFPPARLSQRPPGLKWRFEQYVYGASSHDLYHAGQVQLIKRMYRSK